MATLPLSRFGTILRQILEEEGLSQAEFAQRMSATPAWVSQSMRATGGYLSYPSFLKLAEGISGSARKDRLYNAWLETFAPRPPGKRLNLEDPNEICRYLDSLLPQTGHGMIWSIIGALENLWRSLQRRPHLFENAFAVGGNLSGYYNLVGRRSRAQETARSMQELSRSNGSRAMMAQSLWLEGLAIYPANAHTGMQQLETALAYTENWCRSQEGHGLTARWWQNTILRDRLLAGILLFDQGLCDKDFVKRLSVIYASDFRQQQSVTSNDVATYHEVQTKACIATGDLKRAELLLSKAMSCSQYAQFPDMEVKMLGLCADLAIAQGNTVEAEAKLSKAIGLADRHGFVHYQLCFRDLAHSF